MKSNNFFTTRMISRTFVNQTVVATATLAIVASAFIAPAQAAKPNKSSSSSTSTSQPASGTSSSSSTSTSQPASGTSQTTSSTTPQADTLGSITFDATPKTGDASQVKVTLDNTSNPGKITVTVNVIPYGPDKIIGDINGVYMNLPSGVGTLKIASVSGGPVNLAESKQGSNINDLNDGVNMNGGGGYTSFNLGVRIGTSGGINDGDDYQTTTFTLEDPNGKLTLDSLTGLDFGVRLKSVGSGDSRGGSSKIGQSMGAVVADSGSGSTSGGSTSGGSTSGGSTSGGSTSGGSTSGGSTSGGSDTQAGGGSSGGGDTQVGGGSSGGGDTQAGGGSSGGGDTQAGGGTSGGGDTQAGGGTSGGGDTQVGGGTSGGGDAEQVPEPTTIGGLALGFGALMKWRSNRKNAKK